MVAHLFPLLVASLLATHSAATIIYDPTLVANKTYDFVIAGVCPPFFSMLATCTV